jgi:tRNA pseudouridine38-40 synthase
LNRYQFLISYDGGGFKGSQKQPDSQTVFSTIEDVLSTVFSQSIVCIPAGRTDSGVHAKTMVFHADFSFTFNTVYLIKQLNRHLVSKGIIIRSLLPVSNSFHALSSATSRTYDYFFTFDNTLPHYLLKHVAYIDKPALFIPTNDDLRFLQGVKNYRFLSNVSDTKTTLRELSSMRITLRSYTDLFGQTHEIYVLSITSTGFLYRMVRHIVGLLLHSMLNFTNIEYLIDYISIHRGIHYKLAPAEGLHLVDVSYKGGHYEKETN